MVAQHGTVAMERADRLFEIDLHKAGLTGEDRTPPEYCDAADHVGRAEMEMDGQPVAQRRRGEARGSHKKIEPPRRRVTLRRHDPIAAAWLASLRKGARDIDGAALAGRDTFDHPVLRMRPADAHGDAARADRQPVTDRYGAGRHRAGHDEPDPGQSEGAVDRHAKEARYRCGRAIALGNARALPKMTGQGRDPFAAATRHRKYRAPGKPSCSEQRLDLLDDSRGPVALDPVDLGDDPGDLGDPDQLQDVEVLQCLRARPVIGGDDQQHPVDRQDTGQHVRQKTLMPWYVDKAELGAVGQPRIGEAAIDRQPAPLLLRQAIGVDAGQRLHQCGLAVIDMAGGRQDHGLPRPPSWPFPACGGGKGRGRSRLASAGSWARKAASSSRQRRSSRTRPASMRPMTGTGNARNARASASTVAPDRLVGRRANAALGNSDTGNAPLPIWLRVSTRPTSAMPSSASSTATTWRWPDAAISPCGRVSRRNAGRRSARRSGSA